jgi:hypothetical protein
MHAAVRFKRLVILVLAAGGLAVFAPTGAAAEVTVVATPPNPVVGAPGEVSFEPGLILIVRAGETEPLVSVEIQPGPPT